MSILRFIHFLIRYFRVEIENCCCVVLAYFSGSRNSRISVSVGFYSRTNITFGWQPEPKPFIRRLFRGKMFRNYHFFDSNHFTTLCKQQKLAADFFAISLHIRTS